MEIPSRFRQVETLIVKVTHRCNLDCLYCYENISKTGEDMPLEVFQELVDLSLSQTQRKGITFLFHGGEPTLLPNDWYEAATAYARAAGKRWGKEVHFSMQTNLLSLNPQKMELYRREQIHLGISLDGPARLGQTQRGEEDKVFAHFLRAKAAGLRLGVLMTINQANYDRFEEICPWLVEEAGVRRFKANVVTPVGRAYGQDLMPASAIFYAQSQILRYMIETKGEVLLEENLSEEILRFFATEEERKAMPKALCHERHCGAGERVLGLTPQGQLLPCGRFEWDDERYFLSQLSTQNEAAAHWEKLQDFQAQVPQSWYDCEGCAAKKICGFGCQAFILRSKQQANVDCLPTKMRHQFYLEHETALRPVWQAIRAERSGKRKQLHFQIRGKDGQAKRYDWPIK